MSLEILYDIDTKAIRALNADESQQGNLIPKEGQAVIVLPIGLPSFTSDVYYVDLESGQLVGNPAYIKPLSWKESWKAATTTDARLEVMARRLGLSDV